MRMVVDTSAFLAAAMDEPEKDWLIQVTDGHDLVAPAVLPYEIGNALSALVRRKVLAAAQLGAIWDAAAAIPVELATVDARAALLLAGHLRIYAYDAYFLQCSLDTKCPLLTLDAGMKRVAMQLGVTLVE